MSQHTQNVANALASRGVKPRGKLAKRAARWVLKHADQAARVRVQAQRNPLSILGPIPPA